MEHHEHGLSRMSLGTQWISGFRGGEAGPKGAEAGKGFGTGTDPEYEARLTAVAQEMMEKVEVKDRSHHFKTYKNCFIGKEAVKFLVWSARAANVAEALALGNALMQRGIFSHITNDHSFKNEDLYYQFNPASLPQKGLLSAAAAASGYSSSSLESGLLPQHSSTLDSLKQYSMDPPEELEARVASVAKELQESLPVRDRFWHLKTHKSCFTGREAVKWIVDNGYAGSDLEAIAVGEALLKRGTMAPIMSGEASFRNDDSLFRFRIHDESYLRGVAWLSSSGLTTEMKGTVSDLMGRVDVRDRAGRLMPHKSSFFGRDAVASLIATGHARSIEDAVALGNALMNQQVFSSVGGEHPFRNENLLYRFKAHEDDALPVEGPSGKAASIEVLRKLGWGANQGEELSDDEFERKLQTVARALLAGLVIRDRSWHLKQYKRCFVGRDAVKFLLEKGFASSIDVAVMVGNALLKRGIFASLTSDQGFKNDDGFYRFKVHDKNVRQGLHWLNKARGLDGKLEEAARAMLGKLPIKTRTLKFKKHRKCFVGREAVQFLIHQEFVETVDGALQLGNALMDKGVFSHVSGDHAFKNEANLFYRFKAHEEEEGKGASGAVKRHMKAAPYRNKAATTGPDHDGQGHRDLETGAGGLRAAASGGWKIIMHGLDELAISSVGVDSVLAAVELVGQESIATGLLHWGITHIVFALSYIDDAISSGETPEEAVLKADELLGKAGSRCNEALQYKPDMFRAAMIIAVIHQLRAVMHSGMLNVRETMAYFNACLASGGVLALESGEAAAIVSLNTALDDGQDDPLNQFLASHAANLSSTQPHLQAEKVASADVHFQAAARVMGALIRMLPPEQRTTRGQQQETGSSSGEEDHDPEDQGGRTVFETVCDMWGLMLWEKSQIWAAVGRSWKQLLDQAVDKLREGGTQEADIDLLIACHLMMQSTHH